MANIPPSDQLLSIGRIQSAYGIKGWVWVYSNTDPTDNVFAYAPWYLQLGDSWRQIDVLDWRVQGKGLVCRLDGCTDRNAAEALHGAVIWTAKTNLPDLPEGDYYWSDLVDCHVWTIDNQYLGLVDSLMETGANDVLVVKPATGSLDRQERLIPWIPEQVVTSVDIVGRRITVDWDIDF
ncbi:ribosome maturation factor RimM [Agitococcus lubricus]|uniref:Ribosome maturation factor RimM n=1 Tax=Agitococcus lubricus TaxID=1077255 RepID=A0A2T5IYS7_9GAMM|nr:ribosome maturation factor RimM [Agitococcus lubricus]PTQ89087.1 16S rRNA processing protein RimM [Agitococcus lubricus]